MAPSAPLSALTSGLAKAGWMREVETTGPSLLFLFASLSLSCAKHQPSCLFTCLPGEVEVYEEVACPSARTTVLFLLLENSSSFCTWLQSPISTSLPAPLAGATASLCRPSTRPGLCPGPEGTRSTSWLISPEGSDCGSFIYLCVPSA